MHTDKDTSNKNVSAHTREQHLCALTLIYVSMEINPTQRDERYYPHIESDYARSDVP